MIEFLCDEKGFNQDRVESQLKKVKSIKSKGFQRNLESFFGRPKIIKKAKNKKRAPFGKKVGLSN